MHHTQLKHRQLTVSQSLLWNRQYIADTEKEVTEPRDSLKDHKHI